MTQELPKEVKKFINRYFELNLGNKKVTCPYFINTAKKKDLRALLGKGSPDEIEIEAKIWEKVKGVNFDLMNHDEIRNFLVDRNIGIDCSGFVTHVINFWYKLETGRNIWSKIKVPIKKTLFGKILFYLRPVEKIGANYLTNLENSRSVELNEILPGDLIRLKTQKRNAHHVLLVEEVIRKNGKVKQINYIHSTPNYGKLSGVKRASIKVHDETKPLEDQEWLETDENGINFTKNGYLIQKEDNGIRRLKALEPIQNKTFENM
ncbi:MAG: hypothetical protein KatS3mg085_557 [Candidatus Dojkabacteria bacterium]|nr:MAG: hypothetical protein KatS3mg085_557 [Candidatus Dojkabacteria bacterium]